MRLPQSGVGAFVAETQHQVLPEDTTGHMTMNHERDPAKHPLLANLGHLDQDARNPSRETFVEGHKPTLPPSSPLVPPEG